MSLEAQNSKDSLPQRPRRASLTLQYAPSSLDTGLLAATKIQASYRGYVQWNQTRVYLLEQKLRRIVREHQNELKAITERKWKEMDALRNEAVEEEKRLDSQVELASKLIEHLKRDSDLIKDQTKKLKEHCKTLQHSNLHCEKMAQIQSESIAAMNQNLEQLQKRQDELRANERKCSSKTQTRTTKLSTTSQDVKREFQSKIRMKNVTGIICKTLRQRCRDDNLVGLVSELVSSNTKLDNAKSAKLNNSDSTAAIAERDGNSSHRSLQHSLHDRSVVSDITEGQDAGRSSRDKGERTGFSRSSSFAEYDPTLIVPQLMKTIVEE
jgi:myosin heavy subunit